MALADRVKNKPQTIHGLPCSVGLLLATLEGDELKALKTMLGSPQQRGWSEGDIYDALTAEGHKVGRQSINRHRGGRCRCKVAA
jgi:hypothetical protein